MQRHGHVRVAARVDQFDLRQPAVRDPCTMARAFHHQEIALVMGRVVELAGVARVALGIALRRAEGRLDALGQSEVPVGQRRAGRDARRQHRAEASVFRRVRVADGQHHSVVRAQLHVGRDGECGRALRALLTIIRRRHGQFVAEPQRVRPLGMPVGAIPIGPPRPVLGDGAERVRVAVIQLILEAERIVEGDARRLLVNAEPPVLHRHAVHVVVEHEWAVDRRRRQGRSVVVQMHELIAERWDLDLERDVVTPRPRRLQKVVACDVRLRAQRRDLDGSAFAVNAGEVALRHRITALAIWMREVDIRRDSKSPRVRMRIEHPHVGRLLTRSFGGHEAGLHERLQLLSEHLVRNLFDLPKAHLVVLVHAVDAAAADVVVRMIAQEELPRVIEERAGVRTAPCGSHPGAHRLGDVHECVLHAVVLLLQVHPRRVDARQNGMVGVAQQIAGDGAALGIVFTQCRHEFRERGLR